jgi:hypothetical protein
MAIYMSRRRRSALTRAIGSAAAILLAALASAQAQPIVPDQVSYDLKMSEDPAVKACILTLAIKGSSDETVDFRLVVARTKRADVVAGPAVFGFTISVHDRPVASVHDRQLARRHNAEPHAIGITSAAFVSERLVAAARPRPAPFADGSWAAATLGTADGGELLDAAAAGKFQIAYTRTRPSAARVFAVTSPPPPDVLTRFTGCMGGLQAVE